MSDIEEIIKILISFHDDIITGIITDVSDVAKTIHDKCQPSQLDAQRGYDNDIYMKGYSDGLNKD